MSKEKVDLRSLLARQDKKWNGVKAADKGGVLLPDGRYQFAICAPSSGAFVAQDSDGAVRVRIPLEVVSAASEEFVGKKANKSYTIIDKEGQLSDIGSSYLKADLQLLGAEDVPLSEVGSVLEANVGAILTGAVQQKEGSDGVIRANIFFNNLAKAAGGAPAPKAAPASKAKAKY